MRKLGHLTGVSMCMSPEPGPPVPAARACKQALHTDMQGSAPPQAVGSSLAALLPAWGWWLALGSLGGACVPSFSALGAEKGGCAAEGSILVAFNTSRNPAKAGCFFCSSIEWIH